MKKKEKAATKSVPIKIIFLSVLGVFGLCLIAGVNIYLNYLKNRNLMVLQECRDILQQVQNIQIVEGRFIRYAEETDLKEHAALYGQLGNRLDNFIRLPKDSRFDQNAAALATIYPRHFSIFKQIETLTLRIKAVTGELNTQTQQLISILDNIVEDLNDQETDKMLIGLYLDPLLTGLKSEIKDYVLLWSKNLINTQELLLFSDLARYETIDAQLTSRLEDKRYNLTMIIEATRIKAYEGHFEQMTALIPTIAGIKTGLLEAWKENKALSAALDASGARLQAVAAAIADEAGVQITRSRSMGHRISIGMVLAGILAMLVLSAVIYRSIMSAINSVISKLNDTASRIFDSAGRLAEGSKTLAELSAQSAQSVADAAASLAQISALSVQNSENTIATNRMMKERTEAIERIRAAVEALNAAMQDAHRESDKTFEIIRIIDDIAFQTNLLALNAAIEASRAGGAGAGFAVVSDEVRNLALRSAEAAKNTEELLEGIIGKIKTGFDLMVRTQADTAHIAASSVQVKDLMNDMSSASDSQINAIRQVNTTMLTVKEITNRNQSISEENADVSAEMHQYVNQMKDIIAELAGLAGLRRR